MLIALESKYALLIMVAFIIVIFLIFMIMYNSYYDHKVIIPVQTPITN